MTPDIERLVDYRLEQANETLQAAWSLVDGGHFRDAISRGYYAMFYAALGLLAAKQLGASKHSGVLSVFGRDFVKTGEFPPQVAVYLRQAFEFRQKFDYREFVSPIREEAQEVVAHARDFLREAQDTWQRLRKAV